MENSGGGGSGGNKFKNQRRSSRSSNKESLSTLTNGHKKEIIAIATKIHRRRHKLT